MKDEGVSTKTLVQQAYVKHVVNNDDEANTCYDFGEGDGTIQGEKCREIIGASASSGTAASSN